MVKSLGVANRLTARRICQNSRIRGLWLIQHDPQRDSREHGIARLDIDRILPRGLELKSLNIQHEIPRDEIVVRRKGHLDLRLKGRHDGIAIVVNEGNAKLVLAFVFRTETDPQRQRTLGVHHRHLPRAYRIKTAKHTQLPVVVVGRVAKRGYKNFHKETKRLPIPLASDIQTYPVSNTTSRPKTCSKRSPLARIANSSTLTLSTLPT